MHHALLEALAIALYRRLGFDPSRPVSTFTIARAFLHTEIERPAKMVGPPGGLFWSLGRRKMAIRAGLPLPLARHIAAHEVAHLVFEENGYRGADLEEQCDRLGAALMAPRPAVEGLLRVYGRRLPQIAAEVGGSEVWAALRLAEVEASAVAVVGPATVRTRGAEGAWPSAATLRRWARRPPTGLAKTRLTDDRRRVVLRVEGYEDDARTA